MLSVDGIAGELARIGNDAIAAAMMRTLAAFKGTERRGGIETDGRKLSTFVKRPASIDRVRYSTMPDGSVVVNIGRNLWTSWSGTVSADAFATLRSLIPADRFVTINAAGGGR